MRGVCVAAKATEATVRMDAKVDAHFTASSTGSPRAFVPRQP